MKFVLCLFLSLAATSAFADDARFTGGGSAAATILSSRHPFFTGPRYFDFGDHVYNWLESVVKLEGTWNATPDIALTAGGTGALTLDMDYYERDDDFLGVIDPLRLDIKRIGSTGLSFTLGRQDVLVGDGFIVGDGFNDDAAARYSIPLKYWDGLTVRGTWGRWSALALAANLSGSYGRKTNRLDETMQSSLGRIYTADIAHAWNERTMIGVTSFVREDGGTTDQDLRILSGRGSVPLGGFDLAGEYARQGGTVRDHTTDAYGYHADLSYRVTADAYVRAMVARFSGDDPSTPDYEGFLDWNYAGEDWNRWYLGNNVGSTLLFNENERAYSLEGAFHPAPAWQARLIFERFELDRPPVFAPPNTPRYFATESDFVLEFDAGGGWSWWLLASGTLPGPSARPISPNDRITTETFVGGKYEF